MLGTNPEGWHGVGGSPGSPLVTIWAEDGEFYLVALDHFLHHSNSPWPRILYSKGQSFRRLGPGVVPAATLPEPGVCAAPSAGRPSR